MAKKSDSDLVVMTFEGVETAEALYEEIEKMEKAKLVEIQDAVIVERGEDAATSYCVARHRKLH